MDVKRAKLVVLAIFAIWGGITLIFTPNAVISRYPETYAITFGTVVCCCAFMAVNLCVFGAVVPETKDTESQRNEECFFSASVFLPVVFQFTDSVIFIFVFPFLSDDEALRMIKEEKDGVTDFGALSMYSKCTCFYAAIKMCTSFCFVLFTSRNKYTQIL